MKCVESFLLYGPSGVGKTHQAAELARWINETSGRKLRLYSISGGEWGCVQGAVNAGIIEAAYLPMRSLALETLDRATKGWWPEHPDDPQSPMLPPDKQPDFKDVGGEYYDGLSEACDWAMTYSLGQEASGGFRVATEKAAMPFTDGAFKYASPAQAHYGSIQSLAWKYVAQSKLIGGYLVWTALEIVAQDEADGRRKGELLVGPDVIGKKQTSKAPSWFAHTLHLAVDRDKSGTTVRKMYTDVHFDAFGTPFAARSGAPAAYPIPKILVSTDCSLHKYLTLLQESRRRSSEDSKKQALPNIHKREVLNQLTKETK